MAKQLCEVCNETLSPDHPMCENCGWINSGMHSEIKGTKMKKEARNTDAHPALRKVQIDDVIEKFNALGSCVKLFKEAGGIARIGVSDKFILAESKVIISNAFHDEVQKIQKELGVVLIFNANQTTIRIGDI